MEYSSVRVSTLRGDQKIDFDVFVKINEKYILYLRQGDSFEGPRLKRLKEKKLKKMFILPESEAKYRDYIKRNIDSAYDMKSDKSLQNRAEIIQGQQQSNTEQVFENPEDQVVYDETKKSAQQYVQFLMNNTQAVGSVLNIENTDKSVAHHGVTVSTMSVAIAQKLNTDANQIALMGLGALLHDMGHHDSKVNLFQALSAMSPEDLAIYKQHPAAGATRVQDKKHFDAAVIRIINEHEEKIDGSGFPKGLQEKQMDPLSVIVSLTNSLDRMMTFESKSKADALKALSIDYLGKYPLQHIKLLDEVLKSF